VKNIRLLESEGNYTVCISMNKPQFFRSLIAMKSGWTPGIFSRQPQAGHQPRLGRWH